jgi:hypothetical protein
MVSKHPEREIASPAAPCRLDIQLPLDRFVDDLGFLKRKREQRASFPARRPDQKRRRAPPGQLRFRHCFVGFDLTYPAFKWFPVLFPAFKV